MSEITDWAQGTQCERHDLAYCADCRDMAGMRRAADGTVAYKMDCAVRTFAEITGAGYEEAVSYLRDAGFRPGSGTPWDQVGQAFKAAGFTVTAVTRRISPDSALRLSQAGRCFYVLGRKGGKCHAWSLVDGKASRAFQPPFRYEIFEVTA
jgi:hypothetical protein